MKTTGKFDCNGQEVFVGDKVMKSWGFGKQGETSHRKYKIHTITERPAHMMGNGEMHDDGGGVIYCLGICSNFWKGKEVKKLSQEDIAELGMEDEIEFYFGEDAKVIKWDYDAMFQKGWLSEMRQKVFEEFQNNLVESNLAGTPTMNQKP